jgi:anti-sigma factor RsiW
MESHLTENELAQYVDALLSDKQDQLPEEILEHVEECFECKMEIIEVWELIKADASDPTVDNSSKL